MCEKCNKNEEIVDLGMSEQIHVDGRGHVERIDNDKFVVPYWVWAKSGSVWVRSLRLHLFRTVSSVTEGSISDKVLRSCGTAKRLLHS